MSWVTIGVSAGTAVLGASADKKNRKRQATADNEAAAYEGDRQGRIDMTRGIVDRTFDSPQRQQQYADYAKALREQLGGELIRKKRDESRNLKFALARAGQTGGSVAVDAGSRLGDEYSRAALEGERGVQSSVQGLRSSDAQSRNNLLQLADSGLDATSAVRRGNEALTGNLANANVQGLPGMFGDAFADTAATYKRINERVAQRRGFGYKANRQDLYG